LNWAVRGKKVILQLLALAESRRNWTNQPRICCTQSVYRRTAIHKGLNYAHSLQLRKSRVPAAGLYINTLDHYFPAD